MNLTYHFCRKKLKGAVPGTIVWYPVLLSCTNRTVAYFADIDLLTSQYSFACCIRRCINNVPEMFGDATEPRCHTLCKYK